MAQTSEDRFNNFVHRRFVLVSAAKFVDHLVEHEPLTPPNSAGATLAGVVTTRIEHRLDLIVRVADWLLEE